MLKILLFSAALALGGSPAFAHKVIASVFASGDQIEGEIGFSNGDVATGQTVTVSTPDGRALGTSVTDEDGFFIFTPAEAVDHVFFADLGAGHVAETTMPADEVAHILGQALPPAKAATPGAVSLTALSAATGPAVLSPENRAAIAEIVRDEMRPLRREISAYKEKNNLQTILGGIGYIIGLFGLAFYLAARQRLKAAEK